MNEIWKDVPGYEGYYQVSDYGRVRSMDRVVSGSDGRTINLKSRLMKFVTNPKGYKLVSFCKGRKKHTATVHRLVMTTFVGPRPKDHDICHADGNPSNNSVDNLRYDTKTENNLDVIRHGNNLHSNKTKCPRGHSFTQDNLKPDRSKYGLTGHRACLACSRGDSYVRFHPELDAAKLSDLYLKHKTINKIKELNLLDSAKKEVNI